MSNSKTREATDSVSVQADTVPGRLLALDLGQKRVGAAVSDEMRLSVRPLPPLARASWKRFVEAVALLVRDFDAQALVIGLPLGLDGTEKSAAIEIRRQARNLGLSLQLPVFLQDERLTSVEAEGELRAAGYAADEIRARIDSEAAALILRDFLARG